MIRGLVVRSPFVDWIVDGKKIWELRGSNTKIRGPIALIAGGTGTVIGTGELIEVVGPLTRKQLVANAAKLNETPGHLDRPLYYSKTYAWVISGARRLKKPVPYKHPSGAVIWVKLDGDVERAIRP